MRLPILLIFTFLFTSPFWAGADELAQSIAASSASGGQGDPSCEIEMENAKCDEFFKANPGAAAFKRNCKQSGVGEAFVNIFNAIDKNCTEGFVNSWKEWGATTAEQVQKIGDKIDEDGKQFEKLGNECEKTTGDAFALKKEIVLTYDLGLTDSQIQKLSCTAVLRLKTTQRNRGSVLRQGEDLKKAQESGSPLTEINAEEAEKKRQKIYAAASLWYHEKVKLPLTCYNDAKQADLLCHAIGSLVTPDTVIGASAINKLRKLGGISEGLAELSTAEKATGKAVTSSLDTAKTVDDFSAATKTASKQELRAFAEKSGYTDIVQKIDSGFVSDENIRNSLVDRVDTVNTVPYTDANGVERRAPIYAASKPVSEETVQATRTAAEKYEPLQARVNELTSSGQPVPASLQSDYEKARTDLDRSRLALARQSSQDTVADLAYNRKIQTLNDPDAEIKKINTRYKKKPGEDGGGHGPFGDKVSGAFKTRDSIELCQLSSNGSVGRYFFPCNYASLSKEKWFNDALASNGFGGGNKLIRVRVPAGKVVLTGDVAPIRDEKNLLNYVSYKDRAGNTATKGGNGGILQFFVEDKEGLEVIP